MSHESESSQTEKSESMTTLEGGYYKSEDGSLFMFV